MYYNQEFSVLGLENFKIHFLENNGMAFGMEFPVPFAKYLLTIFRIIAVFAIGYYINILLKKGVKNITIISFSLIMAGALGNIIDSVFYGVIFSDINHYTGGFFQGRVVDMLYFPLVDTEFPQWVPWIGGERFEFFRPVFNIADTSISTGVGLLLVFSRYIFDSTVATPPTVDEPLVDTDL